MKLVQVIKDINIGIGDNSTWFKKGELAYITGKDEIVSHYKGLEIPHHTIVSLDGKRKSRGIKEVYLDEFGLIRGHVMAVTKDSKNPFRMLEILYDYI